ncbi:MAG TPA: hypothetical protein VHG35_09390 [Gemmatimonadales bacterium]|nr:hypothetical protein [Gemmatimonadales bacterium]
MRTPILSLAAVLALSLFASPAAAQVAAPVGLAPFPQPVGLYISGVEESGRYLTLEDGSLWEVEISDRATTASWQPDDFVNVSWIAAPREDFAYLLSRVGDREQRAAVRLAGRRPGPDGSEPLDQE